MGEDNVYPMTFGGYGGISDAEAERLNDRTEAMRFPCRYQVPESMRSKVARRKGADESTWRCGAGVGERCRVPGTDQFLTRQSAHRVRLVDAGRA